ncbi:MAG: HAD-IB family phosphatase [Nitrososphaerota archaeon]|nr:HAD-IB family phosphatase [Nitrososphaerota archaeon]MDG6917643.1 HAD-IB family phosphatase [Nitrososphaerota archaeon]MDG6919055.1 HAD-IB family phosphatase [Nitrososphaerota archaeon]
MNSDKQESHASGVSRRALVCDFDGTITDVDTGRLVLATFSDGDWLQYHEQYLRGEFSFEECLRRQYSNVTRARKASVLSLIDEHVKIRPGFEELLTSAALSNVPVTIATYGLDFCIEHILRRVHSPGALEIYSPKAKLEAGGITLVFPSPRTAGAVNLKEDAVCWYKQRGFEVFFVGDGASDLPAVKKADASFAMRGSELESMCEKEKVGCLPISDFWPVTDALT